MSVIQVRKARAGTDSAGHRWPTDGAVIAVPIEHALALTRIPDGGFTIIDKAETSGQLKPDQDEAEAPEPEASAASTSATVSDQRTTRRRAQAQPSTV